MPRTEELNVHRKILSERGIANLSQDEVLKQKSRPIRGSPKVADQTVQNPDIKKIELGVTNHVGPRSSVEAGNPFGDERIFQYLHETDTAGPRDFGAGRKFRKIENLPSPRRPSDQESGKALDVSGQRFGLDLYPLDLIHKYRFQIWILDLGGEQIDIRRVPQKLAFAGKVDGQIGPGLRQQRRFAGLTTSKQTVKSSGGESLQQFDFVMIKMSQRVGLLRPGRQRLARDLHPVADLTLLLVG